MRGPLLVCLAFAGACVTPSPPAPAALPDTVGGFNQRLIDLGLTDATCASAEGEYTCDGSNGSVYYKVNTVFAANPDAAKTALAGPGETVAIGDTVVQVQAFDKATPVLAFTACKSKLDDSCAISALEASGFVLGECMHSTTMDCTLTRNGADASVSLIAGPSLQGAPEFSTFLGSYSLQEGDAWLSVTVVDNTAAKNLAKAIGG